MVEQVVVRCGGELPPRCADLAGESPGSVVASNHGVVVVAAVPAVRRMRRAGERCQELAVHLHGAFGFDDHDVGHMMRRRMVGAVEVVEDFVDPEAHAGARTAV